MELFVLLLFCPGLFAVKHSVIHFIAGVPDVSEFFSRSVIDGSEVISCDGSNKILEIRHDWLKKILDNNPTLSESFTHQCFVIIPNYFRDLTFSLEQQFNQSEGVHILQSISGCEWDENTNEVFSFFKYGYNGEDFLKLDVKTLTWNALKPEADIIRQRWNADTARMKNSVNILTHICPERLKIFVEAGKSSLQRTVFPSVSLLQRTPSSPVSCHATGFYPDRAVMFWRKDGEELHEGVDHREILPNNDETFQMSVDLNVSSFTPEDWRRYDCAFQLSDGDDNLTITKLDKAAIRSNWGQNKNNNNEERASDIVIPIIAAVILLVLILFSAVGVAVCKKKKEKPSPLSSGNISELSERLNGDAT